jgi:hypothetical protein
VRAQDVSEDVVRKAGLLEAQGVAAAAQLQVGLRDQEAVVGAPQDIQSLLGGLGERRVVEQDAGALAPPPTDPAAQLVELRQAEPLRLFDDHDGGVGHVDADLDDRCGDQHREPAVGEFGHHRVLGCRRHFAVHQPDAGDRS